MMPRFPEGLLGCGIDDPIKTKSPYCAHRFHAGTFYLLAYCLSNSTLKHWVCNHNIRIALQQQQTRDEGLLTILPETEIKHEKNPFVTCNCIGTLRLLI